MTSPRTLRFESSVEPLMTRIRLVAVALGLASCAAPALADDMKPESPAPAAPAPAPAAPAGDLRNSRFFDTHDANLDGKVTKDEYTGDSTLFELLDLDKDGVITLSEVGLPAEYKPKQLPKPQDEPTAGARGGDYRKRVEEFKRQLVEWDADKDGKVTKEEYKGKLPFEMRDRNKDGFLSADDMRGPGPGGMPGAMPTPEEAMARFKAGDKNGDGRVTKDEFVGPAERFDVLDRNKDGAITPDEMEAAMKDGAAGDPGKGRRMFRTFDKNGDGKVARDEFPGGDDAFKQMDKNGDGAITEDELPALPPKDLKKLAKATKAGQPADGSKPETPKDGEMTGPETTPSAPGALPALFAALDRDHDGRLSRAEFSGTDDEWRRLDKDGNGWVTADEAR